MRFSGAARPLSAPALADACRRLGCGPEEVWAVVLVETDFPHSGYLQDRRPQILFERHVFSRLTRGRFDAVAPDISNPVAGGYGAAGAFQYDRLIRAARLDEDAALQAASWGMAQTLGETFREIGYATPQALVEDACGGEDAQLSALCGEVESKKIATALSSHDWAAFARKYNGPNFQKNHYDTRLAAAHAANRVQLPSVEVRAAQTMLWFLSSEPRFQGCDPHGIDGLVGARTRAALTAFQAAMPPLEVTGEIDDPTLRALEAACYPETALVAAAEGAGT